MKSSPVKVRHSAAFNAVFSNANRIARANKLSFVSTQVLMLSLVETSQRFKKVLLDFRINIRELKKHLMESVIAAEGQHRPKKIILNREVSEILSAAKARVTANEDEELCCIHLMSAMLSKKGSIAQNILAKMAQNRHFEISAIHDALLTGEQAPKTPDNRPEEERKGICWLISNDHTQVLEREPESELAFA